MPSVDAVGVSMAGRLSARLGEWPAVRRGRDGYGAVAADGSVRPVLHLHGAGTMELCLTRPMIDRLGDTLRDERGVEVRPGEDWVRVRLDTESDVALALTLISLAIQAITGEGAPRAGLPPCSCRTARTR